MELKELNASLDEMSTKLKTATAEETKTLLEGFKKAFDAELKTKEDALEAKSKTDRKAAELEIKTLKQSDIMN